MGTDRVEANAGVSVVIPAYNAAGFLSETLDSVLAQRWSPLEIVVVDDGSTDETRAVLDSYAERHPQTLRIVRQENQGPAAARNAGILAASHRFVAMLDHDDRWLPDKLMRQMGLLQSDPSLEFCATGHVEVVDGKPAQPVVADWDDSPEGVLDRLLIRNWILTSTLVATRRALIEVGLFNPAIWWGDEYDVWLRVAAAGYRIAYVPEPLAVHPVGPDHLSATFNSKGIDAYIPVITKRFRAGDLPDPIQARRRWYLAHRYLNNACGYLDSGHYRLTITSLAKAAWSRPASIRPGWIGMVAKALVRITKRAFARKQTGQREAG